MDVGSRRSISTDLQGTAAGSAPNAREQQNRTTSRVKEEDVEIDLHGSSHTSSSPERHRRASIPAILNPPRNLPPDAEAIGPSGFAIRSSPPSFTAHRSPGFDGDRPRNGQAQIIGFDDGRSHSGPTHIMLVNSHTPWDPALKTQPNEERLEPSIFRRRSSDPRGDTRASGRAQGRPIEDIVPSSSFHVHERPRVVGEHYREPPRPDSVPGPSYSAGPPASPSVIPSHSPQRERQPQESRPVAMHDTSSADAPSQQGQSEGEPQTWAAARIQRAREEIQKQKKKEPAPASGTSASPVSPTRVKSVRFTGDTIQEDNHSEEFHAAVREKMKNFPRRHFQATPDYFAPIPQGSHQWMGQPVQRPKSAPLQGRPPSTPKRGRPPKRSQTMSELDRFTLPDSSWSGDNQGTTHHAAHGSAEWLREIQLGRFDAGDEAPALPRHLPPMPWFEIEYDDDIHSAFKRRWADIIRIYMNPNVPAPQSKSAENLGFQILDILRHLFFVYTTEGALLSQMASPSPGAPPMQPLWPPAAQLEEQDHMAKWLKRVASLNAPEIRHPGPRHEHYERVLSPAASITGVLGEQYTYNPRVRARPSVLLSDGVLMWCMDILFRTRCSPSIMSVVIVYLVALEPTIRTSMERKYAALKSAAKGKQPMDVPRLSDLQVVFVTCCILASKFECERVYSVQAWARLTGLNATDLVRCELEISEVLQWVFWVKPLLRRLSSPVVVRVPAAQEVADDEQEAEEDELEAESDVVMDEQRNTDAE